MEILVLKERQWPEKLAGISCYLSSQRAQTVRDRSKILLSALSLKI